MRIGVNLGPTGDWSAMLAAADEDLIRFARHEIEVSHRAVTLSVFVWDWPEDIAGKLAAWAKLGVQRTFLTFWHPFDQLAHATKFMS